MLSSATGGEEYNCNSNNLNRVSSSFSRTLSSTCSSSLSPFSACYVPQTPTTAKTMEEVWKDINLSSLNQHRTVPDTPNTNIRSMIFQDFLARPFSRDRARRTSVVSSASASASASGTDNSLYGPPATPPPPATVLSLSAPEFQFGPLRPSSSQLVQPHNSDSNVSSIMGDPFESFACPSGLPSFGNKRSIDSDSSSGDRRHKRMIKNRESAARSRARKQAYTNELEQKVQYLLDENARLRRQHEQICKAAATQVKKSTLYRTTTAPF